MKKPLKDSVLIISIPVKLRSETLEVIDEAQELPQELYELFWEDLLDAMRNRLKVLKT
jgi:hypothetical protein